LRLRGALLGAGNIALKSHAPEWTTDERLRDEIEIVAVADLSPPNLASVRPLLPDATAYSHAMDLLARERIDFCDICTPPFTHRSLIEAAVERGVHILCEKPLAGTLADALEIEKVLRPSRVIYQPCHQYHFSPQWLAVKRLLPEIGRIYLADYQVHRLAANEGNPNWEPRWRTERDLAGGGILVDHGSHIFYQLRSVLGEPATIRATVRTLLHHGYEVEDTAFVTLDYREGVAQVNLTWAARHREIVYRFVGERGELVGDEEKIRIQADTTREIKFADGMSGNSSHAEWYAPLMQDFVSRVRAGAPDQAAHDHGPLDEAIYVSRLIERAYDSSRQGRELPLHEPSAREVGTEPEVPEPIEVGAGAQQNGLQRRPRTRREQIFRGGAFALLLGAVAWTFHDVKWSTLGATLVAAGPMWIALAAIVNFGALLFQAMRWLAVVRPLSRIATLAQSFRAIIVGYTVSMVIPARAGELARAHYLGLRTGLSRATLLGSIVLDHLVDAAGLLTGLALLPFFMGVPDWVRAGSWIIFGLFVVVSMLVAALRPRADGSTTPPGGLLRLRRFSNLLLKVQHGLTGARQPRALVKAYGASLVGWTLEVNVVALALKAVGVELPMAAAFLVLAAVNLALVFPVAPPGNLGTVELGATLALVEVGVPKEKALAFAICYHMLQLIPIAVMGVFFAGRSGFLKNLRRSTA
jgi:uncharacterized protein (TIRG00374 family)